MSHKLTQVVLLHDSAFVKNRLVGIVCGEWRATSGEFSKRMIGPHGRHCTLVVQNISDRVPSSLQLHANAKDSIHSPVEVDLTKFECSHCEI